MPSFLPFLAGGILLFFLFMYFVPVGLWVTAQVSNVKVGILQLVFMRIRKVPPSLVINALITANKAGIPVTANDLETHYMAGGNVNNVVKALISADKANIPLGFNMAAAIETLLLENSLGSCTKAGMINSNANGSSGTSALIRFR